MPVPARHAVLGTSLRPPYADGSEIAEFGMGCFWGAERLFWRTPGVISTAVGYAGGSTPNPTYEEVCTGLTGHIEIVRVVFDPKRISYGELLKLFWEEHDPTQGFRQGVDRGTQYRSAILTHGAAQKREAEATRDAFQERLKDARLGAITTEIRPAPEFYFAEGYHQQYLEKNPHATCSAQGLGVSCPVGVLPPATLSESQ
jgi:peptide-methionine (S)-S-oxide reductase